MSGVNASEMDRLGIVESDVKRILTILDDPDFGMRQRFEAIDKTVDDQRAWIRAVELKVYAVLAAVGGAALIGAGAIVKGVFA